MNAPTDILAGALLLAVATPAVAQTPPAPDPIIRLTPEQREAALESAATAAEIDPINGLDRRVHGEMGITIGTNGTRALYGTAIVPLGETGTAALSVLDARTGRAGRWRNR